MDKYFLTENDKELLTYFTLKGFPKHYRMRLWIVASGAFHQVKLHPEYYTQLVKLSTEVPSLYSDIIQKDLDRTTTENDCQGFNYIVLKILEVVEDEVILYLFNIEY